MSVFFLRVGLEIRRELTAGELSRPGQALLPAVAALGGMVVPALIYFGLNAASSARSGWGIPTATDLAFPLAVLGALGRRVPRSLVVFLTAVAIFDDVGGILILALFYGQGFHVGGVVAAACLAGLLALALPKLPRAAPALTAVGGIALWLAFHGAGLHPTLAGVALGLLVPASLGARLEHHLHAVVTLFIVPLFALASAAVSARAPMGTVTFGVALGLFLGKPVGILSATWIAIRARWAPMPRGATGRQLLGVATLAGMGFTVALFITQLALTDEANATQARAGVVLGSVAAAAVGTAVLLSGPRRHREKSLRTGHDSAS